MSQNDFDFLIGDWRVTHRRLLQRLKGCTEWETAEARDSVKRILMGGGNIGRFTRTVDGRPYEGIPLRLYSPATGLWSIYWMDTSGHKLEPPVVGGFEDGVGVFYGDDVWDGQLIRVRFVWSEISERTARWEQAFSTDNGANWEVNSVMEFARA